MVGVHGVHDVWPWTADNEAKVEVGVEIESKRYTGCSGKLKRGSGGRNNTGEGHLLVVEEQTWRISVKVKRRSSLVLRMSCSSSGTVNEGRRKVEPRPRSACGRRRLFSNPLFISPLNPPKSPQKNTEKDRG